MDGYEGTPTTVGINTFSADVIQSTKFSAGIATVSALSGGISTITAKNTAFPGTLVKENDLIEYTDTTAGLEMILFLQELWALQQQRLLCSQ